MFNLSAKEFSDKYYNTRRKAKSDKYYRLDCESGEGLINPLLLELKKSSPEEFEYYLNFFLKKCININRSFSDAVEFLSIWLKLSPETLLAALQDNELKWFFNRTEYDHDGDKWYFPKLLHAFSILAVKEPITADKILNYLFETFDFFSMPELFVTEIIGYDRLGECIKESPAVFKQALLSKIQEFVKHNTIDIGKCSRDYLNDVIQRVDVVERTKLEKQTERLELVSYLKNSFFIYPSIKNFNPSDSFIPLPSTGSNY